jgi:hypothetical protein
MSAVRVRTGGPADCADIARLNRLFNGAEDSPEAYAARLANPRRVDTLLLAEVAGGVVGIAVLRRCSRCFTANRMPKSPSCTWKNPRAGRGLGGR